MCALLLLAAASLVLNEVLYDPPGSDTGFEFVELFNPDPATVSLAGARLVFINGADPSSRRVVWEAGPGTTLASEAYFLVGETQVPGADAEAALRLQNGPDALILEIDGVSVDAVAWGDLPGLGEGVPAADVASTSLGRVPDGHDTGDNASDWVGLAVPTPGRANARADAFEPLDVQVDPVWSFREGWRTASIAAIAVGFADSQRAHIDWLLNGAPTGDRVGLVVARGDTLRVENNLWIPPGRSWLAAIVHTDDAADSLRVPLSVGPAPVMLNEVMARPASGEPEWIELVREEETADLLGWSVSDRSLTPRALQTETLQSSHWVVVSAQPTAMTQVVDAPVVGTVGGWPALNNSAPADDSVVDWVVLYDERGAIADLMTYDEALIAVEGRSIERGSIFEGSLPQWFASPGAPTPGAANLAATASTSPTSAGPLTATPNPFTPDSDGIDDVLHVVLRAQIPLGWTTARVHGLAGDLVRELGEHERVEGAVQWIWDGTDESGRSVAMGAYVVVARSVGDGTRPLTWRALVALGRS